MIGKEPFLDGFVVIILHSYPKQIWKTFHASVVLLCLPSRSCRAGAQQRLKPGVCCWRGCKNFKVQFLS